MKTERLCSESYNNLVGAIYQSVSQDSPWIEPLEHLRLMTASNVSCIRLAQIRRDLNENIFAAGPKANAIALREWANLSHMELLPVNLKPGEARIVDWKEHIQTSSNVTVEMLERYDVSSMIVMCLDIVDGVQCTLYCGRGHDDQAFTAGDLELLKTVGDHFLRAMNLRRELTKSQIVSQFHTEVLDSLGIAAILATESGGNFLLNRTAEEAISRKIGLKLTTSGLHAVEEHDDAEFRKVLRTTLSANRSGESHAMQISRGVDDRRAHLIIKSRTHRSNISDKNETSALIFLRVSDAVSQEDVKMLQQTFSFTPTEAALAIGLAKGQCINDVEKQLKITHNTARAHLRSMFVKANVTRQAQLVSLVANSLVCLGRPHEESDHVASGGVSKA